MKSRADPGAAPVTPHHEAATRCGPPTLLHRAAPRLGVSHSAACGTPHQVKGWLSRGVRKS